MVYILLAIAIFITDYKLKDYIEKNKDMHKKEDILGGNIIIERYHNKGAMLNFMEDNVKLVKIITSTMLGIVLLVFAFVLPKKGNHLLKFALSLVLGGALSNVFDRIKKGYVVDYFSFKFLKKIVFNISDICIFMGACIIAIVSFIKKD